MSKARKLQQEVESTLKKVNEGVDEWQKLWDKLDQTEDQRDRQKLIDALKNSLKKLKRMRESVRGWLASGEVKDENPLHEARKAIEKNMECFKALEKDLKTKAFSKEGLMRDSTDPAMMARVRCADWLNDAASRLETQADGMEADLEAMQVASASVSVGGKKGRGAAAGAAAMAAERMEHLNAMIERHRDYQAKIDQTLRLLENEQVTPDEVENALRDGLEYFIEAYAEDDFIEDEELWESLPLSEVDEAVGRLRPHEIHAAKGGPPAEGGEEEGVGGGGGGGGAIGVEPSEASAMTSVPAQQQADDATSMNMKPQQDAAALLKSKGSKLKTAKPTAIPPPTKTDSGEAVSSASVSLQPPPGVVVAKPPVPLTPRGVQTSPTAYRGAAPTPPSGLGQQQQQQTGEIGTAPAPAPPAATTTAAAVAAAGHPHVVVSPRAQRPKVSVSSVATATPAVAWSARVAAGLSPAPETTPTSTSATSTPRALKTTTTTAAAAAAGGGGGGGGAAVGGPGVKQGQGEGRMPPPPPPPPPRPPSGGLASPRSPFAYAAAVAVGGGGGEAGGAGISDGVAAVPAAESQRRQQDGGLDGVPSVGKQTSLEALNGHTPFAQQSQQPFGSRSGSETVQGEAGAAAAAADGEGSGAVADPLGALTWHLGTWVEHAEQSLVSRSRVPRVMSPWELALLEASVGNRPQSTDAEWRCTDGTMAGFDERWQPPHPVVTPASYPTRIHPSLMQQSTFNKLSPETQFAAFYFTQNPRQQGFAINALKKAGWRYHTELHHWFSRTGPTDIQPTHERGTLMYWQPNIGPVGGIGSPRTGAGAGAGAGASGGEGIGGWRAAKTGPDFVFDYRYMENSELQVPSA